MNHKSPWIVLGTLALFVWGACGDDESADVGAKEGEACENGVDCAKELFCFVPADGQGVCRLLPTECNGDPDCLGTCMDAVQSECLNSSACLAIGTRVTITCGTPPPQGGGGSN